MQIAPFTFLLFFEVGSVFFLCVDSLIGVLSKSITLLKLHNENCALKRGLFVVVFLVAGSSSQIITKYTQERPPCESLFDPLQHFPLRMAIYDSSSSSWSLEYLISLGHRSLGNLGSSGSGSTSHNSRMESMVSVGGSKSSSPLGAILHSKGTLGYTACVGIVLLLIASRSRDRRLTDSDEQDGNESEESGGESASSSLYQFVFDSLSRLRDLFISSRSGEDYDREEDLDGETFVVHQGSCHCGAIAFEVSKRGDRWAIFCRRRRDVVL